MPIYDEDARAERRRQRESGIPDPLDDAINNEFSPDPPVVPPVVTQSQDDGFGAGGNRRAPRDPNRSGIPVPTGPTAPTTPSNTGSPRDQIAAAYRTYLGREPSEAEIASQMGRGYNLHQSVQNIMTSPEAEAYKKKKATPPTDPNKPPTGPQTNTPQTNTPPGQRNESYDYIQGGEGITYGDTSNLSGFNTNEWGPGGDPNYDEYSYKNIFGKIATRYPSSPDGLRQLVNDPDFKRMFPRAVLVDHPTDPKIKFEPGDPPVDVLASSGARGWQWLPEGEGGGAPAAGGVPPDDTDTGDDSDTITDVDQLGNNDILADIQRALAAAGRGETPYLRGAITKAFR